MTSLGDAVHALRSGAAVIRRPDLYTLRLTGPDRVRFLNGMVSSDVAALQPGRAQRAIKPSNRGRVEGLVRVRAEADAFLIDIEEASAQRVATELSKLIIMDDCALGDATSERDVVLVSGVEAREALSRAGLAFDALDDLATAAVGDRTVIRDDGWLGSEAYEVHVPAGQADALVSALVAAGATQVDEAALEVARIEAGVARDGVDVSEDTIPLEANLVERISFTKGCYVGQEVIARAHNLGGVKHRLVGFRVEGDAVPPPGAAILPEGDEAATGEITSAAFSPAVGGVLALGYVHTKHEAPGARVVLKWEGGEGAATISELPFVTNR